MHLSDFSNQLIVEDVVWSKEQVDAFLTLIPKKLNFCIRCNQESKIRIKDYQTVTIKHSAIKRYKTFLHVKRARYICMTCKKTFYDDIPFVFDDFKDITAYTIISILDELRTTDHSFSEVAENHGVSDSTVIRIFDSRVDFGEGIPTEYLCIDEKCYQHGNTKFMLTIMDFESNKLIDLLPDRKKVTLMNWLRMIRDNHVVPPNDKRFDTSSAYNRGEARNIHLKGFCIDMNQHYYDAIKAIFPDKPIAIDSFHVVKNINHELNAIRISVMKKYHNEKVCYDKETGELLDEEDSDVRQPVEYRALKKYWKLFLVTSELKSTKAEDKTYNKVIGKYADAVDVLDFCLEIDPKLKLAWMLKENYTNFNRLATIENAEEWLDMIIQDYLESGLKPFIKLAMMLTHWKPGIVYSFTRVNGRRISNGGMEGMNSKLQAIISNAHGIPTYRRLRNRSLLRQGLNKGINISKTRK